MDEMDIEGLAEYVREHLTEITDTGHMLMRKEFLFEWIKEEEDDLLCDLFVRYSFTGLFDTGETVKTYVGDHSEFDHLGDVSLIIQIDDELFVDHGNYDSVKDVYEFYSLFEKVNKSEGEIIKPVFEYGFV